MVNDRQRQPCRLAEKPNIRRFNPVKHGHGARAADLPHSSILRKIAKGNVNEDWAIRIRMKMVALVSEVIDGKAV